MKPSLRSSQLGPVNLLAPEPILHQCHMGDDVHDSLSDDTILLLALQAPVNETVSLPAQCELPPATVTSPQKPAPVHGDNLNQSSDEEGGSDFESEAEAQPASAKKAKTMETAITGLGAGEVWDMLQDIERALSTASRKVRGGTDYAVRESAQTEHNSISLNRDQRLAPVSTKSAGKNRNGPGNRAKVVLEHLLQKRDLLGDYLATLSAPCLLYTLGELGGVGFKCSKGGAAAYRKNHTIALLRNIIVEVRKRHPEQ